METKAKITGFAVDHLDNKIRLEIEMSNADYAESVETMQKSEIRLSMKPWIEGRSLNANKYFHLLSDKLADAMRMSKPKMKNYLLFHYGQKVRDDNGNLVVVKTNANEEELISRTDIHLFYLKDAQDGTPMYVLLEHSRFYDSKQMSILIDGTVAECKAQGIETIPPEELARLKALSSSSTISAIISSDYFISSY